MSDKQMCASLATVLSKKLLLTNLMISVWDASLQILTASRRLQSLFQTEFARKLGLIWSEFANTGRSYDEKLWRNIRQVLEMIILKSQTT
jgi:hypothetical protein